MSQKIDACVLCGSDTGDRRFSLVEWADPVGNRRFDHVPRCIDREACRRRVEVEIGEPWPILDGTPAPPELLAKRQAEAEPEAPEPSAVPDAEEALPWLR